MRLSRYFDGEMLAAVDADINRGVPWYIMAAYAYYVEDNPILNDSSYDHLAARLKAQWDDITHPHKAYLTQESVSAQTYLGEYPLAATQALNSLRKFGA